MKRSAPLVLVHYTMLVVLATLCLAPILVIFATSLRNQVQIFCCRHWEAAPALATRPPI